MTVTVAIDSFKGSLTTFEAGESAKAGILRACPSARVCVVPLADGGEGTAETLTRALGGEWVSAQVTGPLGEPTNARYGIAGDVALMEMAQASGLTLVPSGKLDPASATTLGVGEMILDALSRGCRSFVMGIGGSATNDGGMGMLQALGVRFEDENGQPLPCRGDSLGKIKKIDITGINPLLKDCDFRIACDVKNPLCGDSGCSAVFGPQKGIAPDEVPLWDGWMADYAQCVQSVNPDADPLAQGAGAAGGLGFAFLSFTRARLVSGIDLVMQTVGLEERIRDSDLVITGEGRLDGQSCMGKAPSGVAALALKYNKPCVALSGAVTEDAVDCNERGIDAFFSILRSACTLEQAMEKETAKANLSATAEQVIRLYMAAKR